uniref:peroxidase n=1 Tax=Chenopodium quinoa TaxID=63459 RepID=A0A803KXE4_CHEQI
MAISAAIFSLLLIFSAFSLGDALSLNHYAKTCPDVDYIISNAVKEAFQTDKTVPAALLRLHFHDCFIRGCDASVLLDKDGSNKVEKSGPPNLSLHAFFVIDNAKKAVEDACPGVVSCSDILALAARDAVVVRGLNLGDLVALSGGHSLGFSHCSSFQNRLNKFDATHDIDLSINPSFAASLEKVCPAHNKVKKAGSNLDPSPTMFDNTYYKLILQGKSLFSSDQALFTAPSTKHLVYKYASSKEAFYEAFIKSMIKMSSINGGQEIRKNCRKVNS